jgi:hypothetical protein
MKAGQYTVQQQPVLAVLERWLLLRSFLQAVLCACLCREEQLRRELEELVAAASAVQATEASLAVAETSCDALRGVPPVKVRSSSVQKAIVLTTHGDGGFVHA